MSCYFTFDNNFHVPSIGMVHASDMFHGQDGDAQIKEIRTWLNAQGVRDFEPVSLYCDQLKTVNVLSKVCLAFLLTRTSS
jgi:Exoribonuclease Xrn1 D2/D3 domain